MCRDGSAGRPNIIVVQEFTLQLRKVEFLGFLSAMPYKSNPFLVSIISTINLELTSD